MIGMEVICPKWSMDEKGEMGSWAWLWQGWQVVGEREVVLTTVPSTCSSAQVSSPGSSPTADAAAVRGSSAFDSVSGACSVSAFDYLFWGLEEKDVTYQ